jgi:predicted Zn-dependent protease with MMP-like domain
MGHARGVLEMPPERFDALVSDALDTIPAELTKVMNNVVVLVEDISPRGGMRLLGLYEGIPLTSRNGWYAGALPDRITIFRRPILRRCFTEEEVVEQVRITVVHEVAHHFGIDDDRLHELGYG